MRSVKGFKKKTRDKTQFFWKKTDLLAEDGFLFNADTVAPFLFFLAFRRLSTSFYKRQALFAFRALALNEFYNFHYGNYASAKPDS